LNNEIINVTLYNLKKNLAESNIYAINLINIATYTKMFKLSSNKHKLNIIFDYLSFCKNKTILLFIAYENLY
jgi:hypothetical protein